MSRPRFECVDKFTGEVWFRGVSATRDRPCPVCLKPTSNRDGYCAIDWERGKVWCGHSHDALGRSFFNISDQSWTAPPARVKTMREDSNVDWDSLQQELVGGLGKDQLVAHAADLGVRPESLVRLGVGQHASGALSFPMRNASGAIRGVRLRRHDGSKFAVRGSRNMLFIPDGFERRGRTVVVLEGPTDTAAALDLGLNAIGRPSALTCREDLFEAIRWAATVVIVQDNDADGRKGAEQIASDLARVRIQCKIMKAPGFKDMRQWRRAWNLTADQFWEVAGNYTYWK